MNPTRSPIPMHPGNTRFSDAMPNPLYGTHVNAAVAGPSTQRLHPRSNSSPTSLYPAALKDFTQQQRSSPHPPLIPPKPSALTSPLPPSLMPGSAGRSRPGVLSALESSLFFQPSKTTLPSTRDSVSYVASHPYAHSLTSLQKPTLPPKPHLPAHAPTAPGSTAPNIPPKPLATSVTESVRNGISQNPVASDEDELVARALELSLRNSGPPPGHSDSEDDVLARVLEESLASITSQEMRVCSDASSTRQLAINSDAEVPASASSSSEPASSSSSFVTTPAESSFSNVTESFHTNQDKKGPASESLDVENLAKQKEELIRARHKQLEMDEEFARSIAMLEVSGVMAPPTQASTSTSVGLGAQLAPSSDGSPAPPVYNEAVNSARPSSFHVTSSSQQKLPTFHTSLPPLPVNSTARPLPGPSAAPSLGRGYRSYIASSPSDHVIPSLDRVGRSASAQASFSSISGAATDQLSASSNATKPNTVIPVQRMPGSHSREGSPCTPKGRPNLILEVPVTSSSTVSSQSIEHTLSLDELDESNVDAGELHVYPPISTALEGRDQGGMLSNTGPSAIIDEELLMGVSFGFKTPSLSTIHEPMQGPIPNIINLHYGNCPPLHMHAPNWRHLLKLLTRLSDSRIEPSVEALAGTKSELKLRIVIQFMKLHHSSNEWRTIIYLSIDTPVPPSTPNGFRYTNGDVNIFPFSYTMSPVPALLRAGAGDSNLSKCFTVPTTANTTYPTLPISLPDFAMYLHAVLEDSRRAANDTSGGLRKLAKMIDSFYPASTDALEGIGPELSGSDRRGVSGFFKRALGRGNKESQNQRGGNAERFEFITPFRIDGYR